MSRTLVYLIYFTLYSFLLLFIGKSSLRDSDSIAKFFVGEKKTGTRALFFTFVGTWVSAATILGYTGNVYQNGTRASRALAAESTQDAMVRYRYGPA